MRRNFKAAIGLSALLWAVACQQPTQPVEMGFWTTNASPPPDIPIRAHPCGSVVTVSSTHVPVDLDWAGYDVVYQIERDGGVLREWQVPIDRYPVGSNRGTLFLNIGSGRTETLAVMSNGAVSMLADRVELVGTFEECPDGFRGFEGSDYKSCLMHPDDDGTYLAYEAPCT